MAEKFSGVSISLKDQTNQLILGVISGRLQTVFVAPDMGTQINVFPIPSENIWCRYSLEASQPCASNEYLQHTFF